MKQTALYLSILFFSITSFGQNITGSELLNKAISYHDPSGNWATFNGTLSVLQEGLFLFR